MFVCFTCLILKTRGTLSNCTSILNAAGIILVILPLINTGVYKLKEISACQYIKTTQKTSDNIIDSEKKEILPDIYYIIFDRYSDTRTLKQIYDFDNSRFIDYLKNKGFYIASNSTANYTKTEHSLASSLNMEYINYLSDKLGQDSNNWLPLYAKLQDYRVWRILKSKGYKFIHFGTYYGPTSRNKYADSNVILYPLLNEFAVTLYKKTALYPVTLYFNVFDPRFLQYRRVLYKFDKLAEVAKVKEPTFVFAHMITPHPPYVFDRNGSFLSAKQDSERNRKGKYTDQLFFINKKISELIERLLSVSEIPPIIILQSDEGTYPARYRADVNAFQWDKATDFELKEKMRILNAYYLPGIEKDALYSSITPVNSFRIVFNLYFNSDFALLPDENFAFTDTRHPYKFINITNKIR
ncbi:MAG: hypothetical protein ABII27_00765 [bacterium]